VEINTEDEAHSQMDYAFDDVNFFDTAEVSDWCGNEKYLEVRTTH
jgi:aryl-alcohol dehydrogenase-like predicted oxidoreductase